MRIRFLGLALFCGTVAAQFAAASICPSTSNTTTDCDFVITVAANGSISVATVPGSTPFNSPVTFSDGSFDPGGDASLVGVVNNYSLGLTSLTLKGQGADLGIFDFTSNGICMYSDAAYCDTAPSGYEGPTSTFSNLQANSNQLTTIGTVGFLPPLGPNMSTYFALEDSAADINANGGLTVLSSTFANATPEPSSAALLVAGLTAVLAGLRTKKKNIG